MRYLAAAIVFLAMTVQPAAELEKQVPLKFHPTTVMLKLKQFGVQAAVSQPAPTLKESRWIGYTPPEGGGYNLLGSCDSDADCQQATDSMCKEHGYGGVAIEDVNVHVQANGDRLCEGCCSDGVHCAYVLCTPESDDEG